jgi:hypothetical protein
MQQRSLFLKTSHSGQNCKHMRQKYWRLAADLHKDLINVERVAVASMLSLQTPGILGAELDTPEADGFIAECDAAFGQQTSDIAVVEVEVEAIVEPDCVTDDIGRDIFDACMCLSTDSFNFRLLTCQYPKDGGFRTSFAPLRNRFWGSSSS